MIFELEKIEFDKKMELEVPGWEKLCVEYAFKVYSGISWILWRVSGTEHVFQIQHQTVLVHHGADIKDHFTLALQTFRSDFIEWKKENFQEEWMKRYQKMFEKLIRI